MSAFTFFACAKKVTKKGQPMPSGLAKRIANEVSVEDFEWNVPAPHFSPSYCKTSQKELQAKNAAPAACTT